MSENLSLEIPVLRRILTNAGRGLLDGRSALGRIEQKSATEIVTDVDRRVEEGILTDLAESFPDDGVLAEESGATEAGGERTWYIDPLDGTTNYVHDHPFYCVSLGCARGDDLLLGGIYAPALDELYLAGRGIGAILEKPVAGATHALNRRQPVQLEHALLGTGFSYIRDERIDANARTVARFLRLNCHGVRRAGSAALDLACVALGRLDGFWEVSLRPWDVTAGTLVAREAGAVVTDFKGATGRLPGGSILAAAPGLHGRMLEVIRREQWP